jgi:glycosyltransferase involved in cell wall biosynthesis
MHYLLVDICVGASGVRRVGTEGRMHLLSSTEPAECSVNATLSCDRFIMVAPELEGWGAHYLYYVEACSHGWQLATRSPAHVLVGTQCASAIVEHLRRGGALVQVVPNLASPSDLRGSECSGWNLEQALCNLDASWGFTYRDLIFVPTASLEGLLGSARFLRQRGAFLRPRIALLFHDEEELLTSIRNSALASEAAAIPRGLQHSLTLWSTAQNVSDSPLNRLLECELLSLPIPIDPRLARPAQSETVRSHATLGFLGRSRPSKGVDLLLAGMPAISGDLPGASFILQLARSRRHADKGGIVLADQQSSVDHLAKVRLIEDELPPSSFAALLEEIDVLLLPYNPVSYRRRVSGIFALGAAAGKVFVVSRGSSMAAAISEGQAAGAMFSWHRSFDLTLRGLRRATLAAVGSLPALRRLAQERSSRWSQWSGRACVERLCQAGQSSLL